MTNGPRYDRPLPGGRECALRLVAAVLLAFAFGAYVAMGMAIVATTWPARAPLAVPVAVVLFLLTVYLGIWILHGRKPSW